MKTYRISVINPIGEVGVVAFRETFEEALEYIDENDKYDDNFVLDEVEIIPRKLPEVMFQYYEEYEVHGTDPISGEPYWFMECDFCTRKQAAVALKEGRKAGICGVFTNDPSFFIHNEDDEFEPVADEDLPF